LIDAVVVDTRRVLVRHRGQLERILVDLAPNG
jgi:hypothetical protein